MVYDIAGRQTDGVRDQGSFPGMDGANSWAGPLMRGSMDMARYSESQGGEAWE